MPEMICRECSVMHDATKHTPVPFVIPCARHAMVDELAEAVKRLRRAVRVLPSLSHEIVKIDALLAKYEKAVKGE